MARNWKPKKHKKKIKIHLPFLVLMSLLMPFLAYVLFPEGDREISFGIMVVYIFIAATALIVDKGLWLWLIVVLEGSLWRFMYSLGTLEGNYTQENLLWLAGKLVFYLSYSLVFSAFFGFTARFCIWFVKGGDDNHED